MRITIVLSALLATVFAQTTLPPTTVAPVTTTRVATTTSSAATTARTASTGRQIPTAAPFPQFPPFPQFNDGNPWYPYPYGPGGFPLPFPFRGGFYEYPRYKSPLLQLYDTFNGRFFPSFQPLPQFPQINPFPQFPINYGGGYIPPQLPMEWPFRLRGFAPYPPNFGQQPQVPGFFPG